MDTTLLISSGACFGAGPRKQTFSPTSQIDFPNTKLVSNNCETGDLSAGEEMKLTVVCFSLENLVNLAVIMWFICPQTLLMLFFTHTHTHTRTQALSVLLSGFQPLLPPGCYCCSSAPSCPAPSALWDGGSSCHSNCYVMPTPLLSCLTSTSEGGATVKFHFESHVQGKWRVGAEVCHLELTGTLTSGLLCKMPVQKNKRYHGLVVVCSE